MSNSTTVVMTTYGHDKTIDKIAVSVFDEVWEKWRNNERNASVYCDMINALELKDGAWIFAKIIVQNTQYILNEFLPPLYKFDDLILYLDDRAVQKIIREVDSTVMASALHGEEDKIHEKIFKNMSSRASAMLKENIQYNGIVPEDTIKESQQKIVDVILKFIDTGEIIAPLRGEDNKE